MRRSISVSDPRAESTFAANAGSGEIFSFLAISWTRSILDQSRGSSARAASSRASTQSRSTSVAIIRSSRRASASVSRSTHSAAKGLRASETPSIRSVASVLMLSNKVSPWAIRIFISSAFLPKAQRRYLMVVSIEDSSR